MISPWFSLALGFDLLAHLTAYMIAVLGSYFEQTSARGDNYAGFRGF